MTNVLDARSPRVERYAGERGAALIIALMAMLLLTALGLALVLTTSTETMITSNYKNSQEALYAADAGLERAMQDLLTVPDWNTVLAGATTSAFIDGPPNGPRTVPDGTMIDLTEATNMANCGKVTTCTAAEMNASTPERPWGQNNPRWKLYAYGPIAELLPTATINSPMYVIVWVGDDPSENDGDPLEDDDDDVVDDDDDDGDADDGNVVGGPAPGKGVIAMRGVAFGPGGTQKLVEVTIARTSSTEIERGYTGQRGQDEQNRRARKAAVQTPGKALTRTETSTQ